MYKVIMMSVGIAMVSGGSLQASYLARLTAYSKNIIKIAQDKTTSLTAQLKTLDTKKFKIQLEEALKDTVQQAEVIEPTIKDSLKDGSRKSIHMNKSGLFGKAESVIVENVQINHHGSKSWAECFFEWLKTGGQKRVAAVSGVICATGGYAIGSRSSQPVQTQPQIIVMPAQQN
jgi:hypothetical protein